MVSFLYAFSSKNSFESLKVFSFFSTKFLRFQMNQFLCSFIIKSIVNYDFYETRRALANRNLVLHRKNVFQTRACRTGETDEDKTKN